CRPSIYHVSRRWAEWDLREFSLALMRMSTIRDRPFINAGRQRLCHVPDQLLGPDIPLHNDSHDTIAGWERGDANAVYYVVDDQCNNEMYLDMETVDPC